MSIFSFLYNRLFHVNGSDNDNFVRYSRNLPNWLWIAIAKSLGIKLQENEKPILSSLFYLLSFGSGCGLLSTTCWFTVYDIISDYTKTSIIDGTVKIFYTCLWTALGFYAHNLSYRLFCHSHFIKLVKLHSKSLFKMNAAILLFLLMTLFVIVNNINGYKSFENDVCQTVGLEEIVCNLRFFFRVLFSVFALLWNYLVAFVLTSVCRSHVLRIRKFMKLLEKDSDLYEASFLGLPPVTVTAPLEEYSWIEDNYLDDLRENEDLFVSSDLTSTDSQNTLDICFSEHEVLNAGEECITSRNQSIQGNVKMKNSSNALIGVNSKKATSTLSNNEILFNYWKIQTDLRTSSVALQRWMSSVISLVAIWTAVNLVMWLNHDPNLIDLVNLILPLMLLPLLSSAYAEVNQEGLRLLKFICLTENRLKLMLILQSNPLQMTLYNYSLSYQTIATAGFGLLLALASKIIIQKMFPV